MRRLIALVAFIGVACGSAEFRSVVPAEEARRERERAEQAARDLERNLIGDQESEGEQIGVNVVSLIHFPVFIFGEEAPVVVPQPASHRLVTAVGPRHEDLKVQPLPSGEGIAALYLLETSTTKEQWGRLMTPALRKVFAAFVDDEDEDRWLVVVDDVEVTDGPDPVPLVGYRWARPVVEAYAACGIPPTGIDACTDAFYDESEIVFVRPRAPSAQQ